MGCLKLQPIHVRLASHTHGHALVVMAAYQLAMELARRCRKQDVLVEEGLYSVARLCAVEVQLRETPLVNDIPQPRAALQNLLAAGGSRDRLGGAGDDLDCGVYWLNWHRLNS